MGTYRTFKNTERALAKRLGGIRKGHLGGVDIDAGRLAVEVKHKQELPQWLTQAVEQAQRHAREDQVGVTILHAHGQAYDHDLVVVTLADFERLTSHSTK